MYVESWGWHRVTVTLRSDNDSGRSTFSVVVRTTCEDALSGGEAIKCVSLSLDDGTVLEDVEVEAILGGVLFIRAGGVDYREVGVDAVVRMVIG